MWLKFDEHFPTGEIDAFGHIVYLFSIELEPFAYDFGEPFEHSIKIT